MDDWIRENYEKYRSQLFHVAWLILRRTDLAEDAVHMAFSRIIRRPPQIAGSVKAYVLKAVRNAAIDLYRRDVRRWTEVLDDGSQIPNVRAGAADCNERVDEVHKALKLLDQATQEIIHLHIQEGMSFREISELTDMPLQTVASRYRRGLEQIKGNVCSNERSN